MPEIASGSSRRAGEVGADADDPRRTGDHPGGVPAFPVGVRRRLCCCDGTRLWIRTPSFRPRLRRVGPRKSLVPGAPHAGVLLKCALEKDGIGFSCRYLKATLQGRGKRALTHSECFTEFPW